MHERLHRAVEDHNIWSLAKTRNRHQTHTFPPLKDATGTLVDKLELKTEVFKACFFPPEPQPVETHQEDDPPPLPPQQWMPITTTDVAEALKTTTNNTAPGPSSVSYRLLTWAYAA